MDRNEILSKLKGIIKPYLPLETSEISYNENSDLLKDLKINSAHIIDIILDIEKEFDIRIDDEDVEKMATIGDSITTIEKCLNQK